MAGVGDLLQCPICLENLRDPVLLGECGHTFCGPCIELLTKRQCPQCRSDFGPHSVLPNYALRALLCEHGHATPGGARRERGADKLSMAVFPEAPSSAPAAARRSIRFRSRPRPGGLQRCGVPAGMARMLCEEDADVALRVFLLDNSGSTAQVDGHIVDAAGRVWGCTRWDEIVEMAVMQARWNLQLGTPSEFVLLNPASASEELREGVDLLRIDSEGGAPLEQLRELEAMLKANGPRGTTPLAERLRQIRAHIAPEARELTWSCQCIILVIVTDGQPTSSCSRRSGPKERQEVVNELRRLTRDLPVHVVVRLCTDEDAVMDYYSDLDLDAEVELEVLGDITGEAMEIWETGNKWLVYSPLIHRIRESGTLIRLFELLDQRPLTPIEVALFCQLLVRHHPGDPPLPTDPAEFCQAVCERLHGLPRVYDPLCQQMVPPLRLDWVEAAVLPKGPSCRVCSENGLGGVSAAVGGMAGSVVGGLKVGCPMQ